MSSEPPPSFHEGVLIGDDAILDELVRGQVFVAAIDCQRAVAVKHDEGPCPPDVRRIEGYRPDLDLLDLCFQHAKLRIDLGGSQSCLAYSFSKA